MTLPGFLLAVADSKIPWLGCKRLVVPAVSARWSFTQVFVVVLVFTALAAALGCVVSLAFAGQPLGWLIWWLGLFAGCQSFVMVGLMALCWNQRVARLRANPDLPLHLPPARHVTFRWLGGLAYFIAVGVATPVVMWDTIENVRGQLAWKRTHARLVAQGERLTFREILGPEIPASENAGAAPVFAPFFNYPRDGGYNPRPEVTNAIARLKESLALPFNHLPEKSKKIELSPKQPENLGDWSAAYRKLIASTDKDKPAWANQLKLPPPGNPARDVLAGLAAGDAVMAEICEASARPRAQFPVHWDENIATQVQHLAFLKAVQQNLNLRCAAHLAAGEPDAAFADATNALNVAELLREEPLLISQLVRFAQGAIAMRALWEGLVAHRWTDAQLAVFQERLARVDEMTGLIHGFEGERMCSVEGLDQLISKSPSSHLQRVAVLIPFGFLRQNQVALLRYYTDFLNELRVLQTNAPRTGFAPFINGRAKDEEARLEQMPFSPSTMMLKELVPALAKAVNRVARSQATVHLAITACALERHHLARGSYPDTLEQLVPTFLPKLLPDPVTGQSLHYRKTDDGWFLLYSVGEDGKDDAGVFRAKPKSEILDWPWPVPTRAEVGSLF